ncbi:glycoside hydrolase family 43 protein [Pelagicoccus sp. SDUM812003]|uniref:glycoside hydrolase family 43 protein n=1 Tax=Pelagicoccus sp. SDUM812003 TaxID=3041267 RepID=UPI00280C9D84|nr:glycoside hydrolase family 43 protein [Pelagicoccus sp. SDUM812003]MDQ8203959.1 glycoside hydrolase family 43 protein [Pelagicoccus sp. SDUM812003]
MIRKTLQRSAVVGALALAGASMGIGEVAGKTRGNPIVTDMFTADPAPLVHDDTLYIYTGHDIQNETDRFFKMQDWYCFSTENMVDYKNHGPLLTVEDFEWASGDAFASHVTERDGKFYWYVSIRHGSIRVNEGFSIGVAVSDSPTGPFKDAIGGALITDETPNSIVLNIDPAVFIDDDGQAYLYWGSWSDARWVKLKDNMLELDGEVQNLDAKNIFEAPWVHKYKDTYYLSYAGSGYPSKIEYSTSDSPMGPWEYKGVINGLMPRSETNHQAIIEFKGNWYFVYHSSALPTGGVYRRSVCVDKLEYNEDGTIKPIIRTTTSVPRVD